MPDLLEHLVWITYCSICAVLLLYGLNSYLMIGLYLFRRKKHLSEDRLREATFRERIDAGDAEWPTVLTQIPLYNEYNVAERVIRAVAGMDYPQDRHQIQVLDDSDDETRERVDAVVADLQAQGYQIAAVRRTDRIGYKAGALNHGMQVSDAPYIAIFDSDFVPQPDFLKRCLPLLLADEKNGLVQTRWEHLNAAESILTRAVSLGIDGHFVVEQCARSWNGLFLNFNGTAGVWRRVAIEDAGGWTADTLTEDMDLSYRAQLRNWRIHYTPEVATPAEIPNTFTAFKSQQFRWAKGSIETAVKLLPAVFRAPMGTFKKVQAFVHLTHYMIHFAMVLLALLSIPLLLSPDKAPAPWFWHLALAPVLIAALGPSLLFATSQLTLPEPSRWRRLLILPALVLIGFGISLSNSNAVWQALRGKKSGFVRTPKKGDRPTKRYGVPRSAIPLLELLLGVYCFAGILLAVVSPTVEYTTFLLIFALGYTIVGTFSLIETRRT